MFNEYEYLKARWLFDIYWKFESINICSVFNVFIWSFFLLVFYIYNASPQFQDSILIFRHNASQETNKDSLISFLIYMLKFR